MPQSQAIQLQTVMLRPMTQAEYETWRPLSIEAYAHERARNLDSPIEEQRAVAERQFDQFLPTGLQTEGAHLWHVVLGPGAPSHTGDSQAGAEAAGEIVGTLWVQRSPDGRRAFIYSIEIDAPHRRRGYGRRALQLLEDAMRPLGVRRIALNVFADNPGAQALYRQLGYEVTNLNMQKTL